MAGPRTAKRAPLAVIFLFNSLTFRRDCANVRPLKIYRPLYFTPEG